MKRKKLIKMFAIALTLSMLIENGSVISAIAAPTANTVATSATEGGQTQAYSTNANLNIVERIVSNSNNFGTVPEDQKTGNVPAQNKKIAVDMTTNDVIDYLRFTGTNNPVTKANRGNEIINFKAEGQTSITPVNDWTNLPITYNDGSSKTTTTTATNFYGKNNSVSFSVKTEAGKERILDIYVGGHPDSGSYTATATMGGKPVSVTQGSTNTVNDSYSYTPGSSLVTHYQIKYTGTGEDLTFKVQLNYTGNVNWAGICVAGAVLRDNSESEDANLNIVERIVSNSSNFGTVPEDQKIGNVPAQNKQIAVNMTTSDVVDYLRFTGTDTPVTKQDRGNEVINFNADGETKVVSVNDWNNLPITYNDGNSNKTTTMATNFYGKNNSVSFSVKTEAGKERILDIYVGGHPDSGSYTATAIMGGQPLSIIEGSTDTGNNSYSYTPKSSLITHYQIKYTGTGEDLTFKVQLNYTGSVDWTGICIGGAVLRSNDPVLSANKGNFDKSTSDIANSDVSVTLNNLNGLSLTNIKYNGNALKQGTDYNYDSNSQKITFLKSYMTNLKVGTYPMTLELNNGKTTLNYTIDVTDSSSTPRPYVKDTSTLFNSDLSEWNLWYSDEFDSKDGKLDDWWETSYLKWWNYSSESNEKYNEIYKDSSAVDNIRGTDGSVLRQFVTETMRADSIVTRMDNFRNPGITLGVRDLNHNYGSLNLMNYQHMPTDDRGATAYGYFEIRAKITGGTTSKTVSGSSAWWFTGFQDASWQTTEVDMVEYGYGVSEASLNGHFASPNHVWRDPFATKVSNTWDSNSTNGLNVAKPADDYHVYGFEWTPTGMNGYFDGKLVWTKNLSVNYRMLMWISLNAHARDTYSPDNKEHLYDYVRIWKTDALEQLEKEMVTRNIIQKLQPEENNVATLAYAGANGISSGHYQKWDPRFLNDNDVTTSFKVMTPQQRKTGAKTAYNSDDYYLYLDWVKYTQEEIDAASKNTETLNYQGKDYTFASEYDVRRAKTVSAVELVVNKTAGYKTINKGASDNSTGTFVYDLKTENSNLFPYKFDIEYSADGYTGWTPIATDVVANWDFNNGNTASFVVNVPKVSDVNHLRINVKSVYNSDTKQEVGLENGFSVAEIKVYESAKDNAEMKDAKDYNYNHAVYSTITVTDKDGKAGSADMNFPVTDVADGVYINEFRSSGDGTRLSTNPQRVDVTKQVEVIPTADNPQYINFKWDAAKTIDNFAITIGYMNSAPTEFTLEYLENGQWKELKKYTNVEWKSDFETFKDTFNAITTDGMRLKVTSANLGPAIDSNQGVERSGGIRVCIAPGYYSIAEIELNETKTVK
ncbi:MAG: hypothetical protein IJO26_02730 [Clostridium sp.]|nr:hypothetical protein [Clostridium sp.]